MSTADISDQGKPDVVHIQTMKEFAQSTVSDAEILSWLKTYVTPRIRLMRVFTAFNQMAKAIIKDGSIPEFIMPDAEWQEFKQILNSVAQTESITFGFEPNTHKTSDDKVMGWIFGCMPVLLEKNAREIMCRASTQTKRNNDVNG